MKRKLLCVAIAALMLIPSALPGYAANIEDVEAKRFDAFGEYTVEFTEDEASAYPKGYGATSGNRMKNAGYVEDAERFGKVVKLGTGASMLLPIGKIFEAGQGRNGWIHLSFDIKLKSVEGVETSKNKQFQLLYNSSWQGRIYGYDGTNSSSGWVDGSVVEGTKKYDPDNPDEIAGDWASNFLTIGADNLGRKLETYHAGLYNRWNEGSDKATNHFSKEGMSADEWHKIEVFVRESNGNYIVYMDGVEVETFGWDNTTGSFKAAGQWAKITPGWWKYGENKVKGFEFRSNNQDDYVWPTETGFPGESAQDKVDSGDGGAFLVDNVYMNFYRTNDELTSTSQTLVVYDDPVITCDDKGGIELVDGVVAVASSEWLKEPVDESNVTVKNISTGEIVKNYTVSNSDNMQFELVFDDNAVESGFYEVSLSGVYGALTGSEISSTAIFKTLPDVVDVDGIQITVPRVEKLSFFTSDGKIQDDSTKISTEANIMEVDFSTAVDETDLENKITISDGVEAIPFTYDMSEDNKKVIIVLDKFMKPSTEYTVTVDSSVIAKESLGLSEQVSMRKSYDYGVKTLDDGSFTVIESNLSKTVATWNAKVKFRKTNTDAKKYTMAVVVYQNGNDGRKQPVLVEYKSLDFGEDDRSITTFDLTGQCKNKSTTQIKLFVIEYPSQKVVMTKSIIPGDVNFN